MAAIPDPNSGSIVNELEELKKKKGVPDSATIRTKIVRGRSYSYFQFSKDGKTKTIYIGPTGTTAKKKSKEVSPTPSTTGLEITRAEELAYSGMTSRVRKSLEFLMNWEEAIGRAVVAKDPLGLCFALANLYSYIHGLTQRGRVDKKIVDQELLAELLQYATDLFAMEGLIKRLDGNQYFKVFELRRLKGLEAKYSAKFNTHIRCNPLLLRDTLVQKLMEAGPQVIEDLATVKNLISEQYDQFGGMGMFNQVTGRPVDLRETPRVPPTTTSSSENQ